MAARSGVDAMRATARDGRDADEASPMGAGAAGRYSGDGARWERAAARGRDGGAAWRAPWERAGGGKQNWGAALAAHGCRMRAMAHFWLQWDGCCEGGCREGEMKKRPHMRPLYVKAISFERLYGKLERELRLSSSRRESRSSSWGEHIRGILQEPWCQQRCDRSYGIPKP